MSHWALFLGWESGLFYTTLFLNEIWTVLLHFSRSSTWPHRILWHQQIQVSVRVDVCITLENENYLKGKVFTRALRLQSINSYFANDIQFTCFQNPFRILIQINMGQKPILIVRTNQCFIILDVTTYSHCEGWQNNDLAWKLQQV